MPIRTKFPLQIVSVVVATFALVACSSGPSEIVLNEAGNQNTISVTGVGKATIVPDSVSIRFTVVTDADDAEQSSSDNAAASAALVSSLEESGVAEEKIKTLGLTTNPMYDYDQDPPAITTYKTTHLYEVSVDSVEKSGLVIDNALDAVGDPLRVDGTTPIVTDDTQARIVARGKAIDAARKVANQYAEDLGFALGPVVSISENTSVGGPSPIAYADAELSKGAPPTEIQGGEDEVSMNVNITWEISAK